MEQIVNAVAQSIQELRAQKPQADAPVVLPAPQKDAPVQIAPGPAEELLEDLTSPQEKQKPRLTDAQDFEALVRMKHKTAARIGIGKRGPRLDTKSMLTLRADHAMARDSVFADVAPEFLEQLGLACFQTRCKDKDEFLTRPDLGREFDPKTEQEIRQRCEQGKTVVIYASDGLSSKAIEANLQNILPAIREGLAARSISMATPFFVRFGRVAAMDHISELLGSEITCVLIGERPGLATAESMSCYMAYKATVGMPESRRTVVSNIHSGGITAVEAGAYIAEVIEKMLAAKASGVDLKK
ncbi:MAG: ethanolamine ammonia-lyase subunit EutC [Anaerotruncus sp.]|nr:ethanolamine ammonia-lyase subunit EutC [Anaerotruncus sp.]